MTPQDLARLHPKLYHVADCGAADKIRSHGLWSTERLLDGTGLSHDAKNLLLHHRRATPVLLKHQMFGEVTINDNRPISEKKLAACLDNSLTSSAWLGILNRKIFFWTSLKHANELLSASSNRNRPKELLVFDALRLFEDHFDRVSISPINSGSTIHQAARRGNDTFAKAADVNFSNWRKRRGLKTPDRIKEIVVDDGVGNVRKYLLDILTIERSK